MRVEAPKSASLLRIERIASLMFADLEAEKLVDRSYGFLVRGLNDHPTAGRRLLEREMDLAEMLLHHRDTWRNCVVDKHRNREVTVLKSVRDVLQVHLDVVAIGGVIGAVCVDLDYAAVGR